MTPETLDLLFRATIWHVEERSDGRVVLVLGHHGGDDNFGYVVVEPTAIHLFQTDELPQSWEAIAESAATNQPRDAS